MKELMNIIFTSGSDIQYGDGLCSRHWIAKSHQGKLIREATK